MSQLIELVTWTPIAIWNYKATSTDCAICREKLVQICVHCSVDNTQDVMCYPSKGKCGHIFHKHCIDKWLTGSTICPICTIPYNIDVSNLNNNDDWKKLYINNKKN